MATATVSKKIIPAVEEITGVTLTLTKDEAETLRQVFHNVGGHPNKKRRNHVQKSVFDSAYDSTTVAPRGHIDRIDQALYNAGVKYTSHPGNGSFYFEDVYTG